MIIDEQMRGELLGSLEQFGMEHGFLHPIAVAHELARLWAIVDKLPKTADGVHVLPGDPVWDAVENKRVVIWESETAPWAGYCAWFGVRGQPIPVGDCYSTPEAAEAAQGKEV